MKICYKCGERLFAEQKLIPTQKHGQFKTEYHCRNGHTGIESGQAGTNSAQWTRKGEVWSPEVRSDVPDDYDGGDMG